MNKKKVYDSRSLGEGRTLLLGWDGHLYTVTMRTRTGSREIGSFISFSEANIEFWDSFKELFEEDINPDYPMGV